MVADYLAAEYTFCDPVKFGAVGYHAGLGGLGGRDSVSSGRGKCSCCSWLTGAGGCGTGRVRVFTNDANASVGFGPEAGAVTSCTGVPGDKFGQRDAETAGDSAALLFLLDEVEFVAVRDDFGLSGEGG